MNINNLKTKLSAIFLTAAGTADNPITIRGGDPTAGSWGAIVFRHSDGPYNTIQHVNISHGSSGAPAGSLSFRDEGLIRLNLNNSMTVTVNNVTFSEFSGTGCPVGYSGTLSQLSYSNLTDDQGRLPACIN